MNKEFRLPDVGEGLTEADIVSWHVKPGDTVTINQVIVEIETAKAVVELPSPYAGTVSALLVDEGQTVDVGIPIITIDVPVAGEAPAEAGPQPPAAAAAPAAPAPPARQPVLVGYGVKPGSTSRRPRKSPPTRPGSYPASPAAPGASRTPTQPPGPAAPSAGGPPGGSGGTGAPPIGGSPGGQGEWGAGATHAGKSPPGMSTTRLAKPPVRRLARDLGIDLGGLTGSGPEGSVTKEDVQKAAGEATVRSTPRSFDQPSAGSQAVAELSLAGPGVSEERIPVRGVRKHTAAAMVASAFTAPHVTEFLQVDVTETMAAVRRTRELAEFAGVKVSPLLFVAKALLVAVRRHPMINSTWDEAAQEIVIKRPVNLGIAVAAERGLLVPNVKGADRLPLADLARAVDAMASTARTGKATPEDLAGGTITITNVGVFGVDAGTPILLPGEAAILAFGQVRDLPWVVDGALAVRKVTTLSLSFDHRIVDGELGSAVLRDVGSMLEDPVRMLAWS
jgi:2-oxoisovalerate dehydrogenase E2 component (dihydrolipoyl transacylase)